MARPEEDGQEDPQAEADAFLALADLTLHEVLLQGQEALLRRMVAKAQAGSITHQEAAVLRNLLRDNGMTMAVPPQPKTIEHQPAAAPRQLPVFERPDYEED